MTATFFGRIALASCALAVAQCAVFAEESADPPATSSAFDLMFVIRKAAPGTTVQPPKADAPVPALSKKAYAYGTRIAAAGDGVTIELGGNCLVKMGGGTVATVLNAGGTKMIVLDNGQVQATTPANNTDNLVSVRTLFGTFSRVVGTVDFSLAPGNANDLRLTVDCKGGEVAMDSEQIEIPHVRLGGALAIQGTVDGSYMAITGRSGDFLGKIEHGTDDPVQVSFRPGVRAKIWRRKTAFSDKQAISVMILGTGGSFTSYSYLQGEAAVDNAVQGVVADFGDKEGDASAERPAEGAEKKADDDLFGDAAEPAADSDAAKAPAAPAAKTETSFDDWDF